MNRLLGNDINGWNQAVDFGKMAGAGAAFTYVKASQLYAEPTFPAFWAGAKEKGIPRGPYHYLDWHTSELAQADLFMKTVNSWNDLPPMLDLEQDPSLFGLSASLVRGRVWNWLTTVEKYTGRIPIIYCGFFFWLQWMTPDPAWAHWPFWLPWYASEENINYWSAKKGGINGVPKPWTNWTFWQYTGNGPGPQYGSQGLSLDMDWFNGSADDLKALMSGQTAPTPVATPLPTWLDYVTLYNVNIRNGPSMTATLMRIAIKGSILEVCPGTEQNGYIRLADGNWVFAAYIKPQ
jgi:lysozyme